MMAKDEKHDETGDTGHNRVFSLIGMPPANFEIRINLIKGTER